MQRYRGVRRAVEPILDVMQTVPTFAYLIPMLAFFGLGPVVGVVASAIYAVPPMARNVCVAIERIPAAIVEAGRMSGATDRQLLFHILLPTALPGILLGVNQTIMAVLSMAVISSILGGSPDIGWEIILTMKRAQFGDSIVAGLVLALIAMILDRTSRGLFWRQSLIIANREDGVATFGGRRHHHHPGWVSRSSILQRATERSSQSRSLSGCRRRVVHHTLLPTD